MKIGCFLTSKMPRNLIFIEQKQLPKWRCVLREIETYQDYSAQFRVLSQTDVRPGGRKEGRSRPTLQWRQRRQSVIHFHQDQTPVSLGMSEGEQRLGDYPQQNTKLTYWNRFIISGKGIDLKQTHQMQQNKPVPDAGKMFITCRLLITGNEIAEFLICYGSVRNFGNHIL